MTATLQATTLESTQRLDDVVALIELDIELDIQVGEELAALNTVAPAENRYYRTAHNRYYRSAA